MKVSEVLNGAGDHIERWGHNKGSGFGEQVGETSTDAPACTIGAIYKAVEGDLDDQGVANIAIEAMSRHVGQLVIFWNDMPERTPAEVVEALRAAAVIEQARETELEAAAIVEAAKLVDVRVVSAGVSS